MTTAVATCTDEVTNGETAYTVDATCGDNMDATCGADVDATCGSNVDATCGDDVDVPISVEDHHPRVGLGLG